MQAPDWLKKCHPNSFLNARDFSALLGINRSAFAGRVRRGSVPPPTFKVDGPRHNCEWRVGDLLKDFFKDDEDEKL